MSADHSAAVLRHLGVLAALQRPSSTYDPNTDPPGFLTKNAAAATSKGFEWFLAWRATPTLQVSWNGAYLDAQYDDFPGAECLARQANSVRDPAAPVGAPNSQANSNIADDPLNVVSKWSGSIDLQHALPLGDYKIVSTAQGSDRSTVCNGATPSSTCRFNSATPTAAEMSPLSART